MPTKIPCNVDWSHNKSACKEYKFYSYDLHSLLPLPLISLACFSEEWLLKWFWERLWKCTCLFNVLSEEKEIKEMFGKKCSLMGLHFSIQILMHLTNLSTNIFPASLPRMLRDTAEEASRKLKQVYLKSRTDYKAS